MIDLKLLREQPTFIQSSAKAKNIDIDVDRILDLDRRARSLSGELESMKAQKNEASKRIPKAAKDERVNIIEDMRLLDRRAESLETDLAPVQSELEDALFRIPNPALPDVKVGANEDENEVVREVGERTAFSFAPKGHLALGEALDIIDTERAAKVSGARFAYLKGMGVKLEFALHAYATKILERHGFLPVVVPNLVTAKAMRAMGYLEHGGHEEIYYLAKDNLYLIGTAEQALGPLHMDEIIDVEKPVRYYAFSPCYRREAGGYGKDTQGIIRVHQFDKIEMFSYVKPEAADAEHETLLAIEEELMQGLGIPYRVIKQCTGDLGLPAARKYDIEAWMPSQEKYRETHSTSNCTDWQARRLNTRYRTEEGTALVSTLNGTAFAIGRTIVAILANFPQADGSVVVPDALRATVGADVIVPHNT